MDRFPSIQQARASDQQTYRGAICTIFAAVRRTAASAGGTIGALDVPRDAPVYRFGPFELDSAHRRLRRGNKPVPLPGRQMEVLVRLAAAPGEVVPKEALIEAAWRDMAVTDNSIVQAIRGLRNTLGTQPDGAPYIETWSREGYRFVAPVERGQPRQPSASLDTLLAPFHAFVDGRAALERLNRDAILCAREAFDEGLGAVPDDPAAHIGFANACVLMFESTRADLEPDVAALQEAEHHAREGCRLDPSFGDAWSTLALVRHRCGDMREAVAAARKAVSLAPNSWQHYVRLAFVTWGEPRLRAANRMLALRPGLAMAHWFAATVFVAREAFDAAQGELGAGCALHDVHPGAGRFRAVGLHLLSGLVTAARGDAEAAIEEICREITSESDGHVYARECCANAAYSIGALHLRQGRREAAATAFREALTRVPGHPFAAVGVAAVERSAPPEPRHHGMSPVDRAMVHAAGLALNGRHHDAARFCADALAHADRGASGWLLPVEPLLHVRAQHEAWAPAIALVRDRAS